MTTSRINKLQICGDQPPFNKLPGSFYQFQSIITYPGEITTCKNRIDLQSREINLKALHSQRPCCHPSIFILPSSCWNHFHIFLKSIRQEIAHWKELLLVIELYKKYSFF